MQLESLVQAPHKFQSFLAFSLWLRWKFGLVCTHACEDVLRRDMVLLHTDVLKQFASLFCQRCGRTYEQSVVEAKGTTVGAVELALESDLLVATAGAQQGLALAGDQL